MPQQNTATHIIPVATLGKKKATYFKMALSKPELHAMIEDLDVTDLQKLKFEGSVRALGRTDWQLSGQLAATVVQPCSITLSPVRTRIETKITRRYLAQMPEPRASGDAAAASDPDGEPSFDDETIEPLGAEIDLMTVLREALLLEIPDFPRSAGAELGAAQFTEQGLAPMTDQDARPFAGLADLKAKLEASQKD